MSATCPQCADPELTVPIPQALADTATPLDGPTRALLSPPPEPAPARLQQSAGALILFAFAAFFFVTGIVNAMYGHTDLSRFNASYQAGYRAEPFVLPAILVAIGMAVRSRSRTNQRKAAEQALFNRQMRWQQHLRVWQTGWLCRRCLVTFFPEAAFRPDFPASPAIPVEQLAFWVMTAAQRAFA